jgi:cell division protein ZapE
MPVTSLYEARVSDGRLEADPAQRAIVKRLDALAARLAQKELSSKGNPLGWLFGRQKAVAEPARGLYIWGSVGRGKTMLMDLLFEALPVRAKRRAHFHDFMADVHERIHRYRQELKAGRVKGDDPIAPVAATLAAEARVLCFDEFTVTDIGDAMILGRLFRALWSHGVVAVATSNVEPSDLYRDGLNRALFLPFIAELEARMEIVRLDARTDYRMEKLGGAPVYLTPADAAASRALDAAWVRMTGDATPRPAAVAVRGRVLAVPAAAAGVARFAFGDLCARPLAASDYLALAREYHTLLLDGVPVLEAAMRNEAKRFITLVDVLYEHNVKLVVSAAAEPSGLAGSLEGREAFEFARTASRLVEMRSDSYLGRPHGRAGAMSADLGGLVET